MLLSSAIDEYLASRKAEGLRPNTLRHLRNTLGRLLRIAGNVDVRHVNGRTVDAFFADAGATCSAATLNNHHASLGKFFRWCRARRFCPTDHDPMEGRGVRKVLRKQRRRLPVGKFPALLDAATHPRDRMVLALGIYLFLRQSEIATLKVADVDLESGFVRVTVHKTQEMDHMPICPELDTEIRRWLTFYSERGGEAPLDPTWLLCPAKRTTHPQHQHPHEAVIQPLKVATHLEQIAQRALVKVGFPVREGGVSTFEGIHTLRRSGARALLEELRRTDGDGALLEVSSWLHHSDVAMTQRYLGMNEERDRRDKRAKGRLMYPSLSAAVPLHSVERAG